jgi:hypothetical protein
MHTHKTTHMVSRAHTHVYMRALHVHILVGGKCSDGSRGSRGNNCICGSNSRMGKTIADVAMVAGVAMIAMYV